MRRCATLRSLICVSIAPFLYMRGFGSSAE